MTTMKPKLDKLCYHCFSELGHDCGDAEPDYNQQFCSVVCYKKFIKGAQRINKKLQEAK